MVESSYRVISIEDDIIILNNIIRCLVMYNRVTMSKTTAICEQLDESWWIYVLREAAGAAEREVRNSSWRSRLELRRM